VTPDRLALASDVARRLGEVHGVVAVALGGSVATGTADASSDVDLGVYSGASSRPSIAALRALARELDDEHRPDAVTAYGEWGPWIDGGAWLTIGGTRVDWLHRDLDRVERVISDCREGRFEVVYQPGHPHAFLSSIYLFEVREGVPLHDPTGALGAMRASVATYPPALRAATVERALWEARFALDTAAKPADRGDVSYVAGSAYRCLAWIVQLLHALNERSFRNEKRSLAASATFPLRPAALDDGTRVLAALGGSPAELRDALRRLAALLDECAALARDHV
jgi:predicted nucleotidyltransferase